MAEEISKHTITILVILTVVISFLGTWTVMNEVSQIKSNDAVGQTANNEPVGTVTGKVGITILDPDQSKGKVSIEIKE